MKFPADLIARLKSSGDFNATEDELMQYAEWAQKRLQLLEGAVKQFECIKYGIVKLLKE